MGSDSLFSEPGRTKIVSSNRMRKFQEFVNAQLGTVYHRILKLLGDTRTLVVCNTLTNLALVRLLAPVSDNTKFVCSPFSVTPLYPTTLKDAQKADYNREIGYIAAGIVGQQKVFLTQDGRLDPRTRLTRTSELSKDTSSPVWAILENELENVLIGETPYIARFASKSDPGEVDMSLTIATAGTSFLVNAVRIIPVPIAGGVAMANITHSGGSSVFTYNHTAFSSADHYTEDYSYASYIPFEPVKTTQLTFKFLSALYSSILKCTAISIARVAVEYNVYAQKSYVGFYLESPSGASVINQVTTLASAYSPSLEGIRYYFYPDLTSFNLMSSEFVGVTGPNQYTNLPAGNYYVLAEIPSKNNCSPVIRSISFHFA